MKLIRFKYWFLLFVFLVSASLLNCYSQTVEKTVIKGVVTDAKTGDPVPFVSVVLKNTTTGTVTDDNGRYLIETVLKAGDIAFSFLGYETESRTIQIGKTQIINIKLNQTSFAIDEVVIKPKRRSYSKKNNPAIDLIEKVIEKKSENRKEGYSWLEYEKYEKTQFALSNITEEFKDQNALYLII
jgi:hypothetical protein